MVIAFAVVVVVVIAIVSGSAATFYQFKSYSTSLFPSCVPHFVSDLIIVDFYFSFGCYSNGREQKHIKIREFDHASSTECGFSAEHAICPKPAGGTVLQFNGYVFIDWTTIFAEKKKLFSDWFAAVVMGELVKLVTCLVLVFYEEGKNADRFVAALHRTIIKNPVDTIKICIPSLLYVIQNNLLYVSASNLDAATNQVRSSSLSSIRSQSI